MPAQDKSTCSHLSFTRAQAQIGRVVLELEQASARLNDLCSLLPEPAGGFDPRAELRGIAGCVWNDLLLDAIATLRAAARQSTEELERASRFRQELGACPDGVVLP